MYGREKMRTSSGNGSGFLKIKPMQGKLYGFILVFIAAVLWSFGGAASKYLSWSSMSVAFVRGTLAAITIGFFNKQWIFRPNRSIMISATCIFGTSVTFMISNKITTSANAIILQYTAPAFIIIISVFFLKEKILLIDIITVIFNLLGISLCFVEHIGHSVIIGDILAVISGLFFAGVFLANRLPGANPAQASYLGCLLHILLFPFFITDQAVLNFQADEWIISILLGIIQMGVAYIMFSKGIRIIPAFSASIICTIEPILNPIWALLLIGEKPGLLAIVGSCIVLITVGCYNIITYRMVESRNNNVLDMRK